MTLHLHAHLAAGLIRDGLEAPGIATSRAASDMHVPRCRLSDIFADRKGVSAETALRFERHLGLSADATSIRFRLEQGEP